MVDENLIWYASNYTPEEIRQVYPNVSDMEIYEAKLRDPGLGLSEEEIQMRLNEQFPTQPRQPDINLTNAERGSLMDMGNAGAMPTKGQGMFDEEYMRQLMQRMKGGAGPSLYNPGINFQGGY